jgi:small-conductance mechanosensitive channel
MTFDLSNFFDLSFLNEIPRMLGLQHFSHDALYKTVLSIAALVIVWIFSKLFLRLVQPRIEDPKSFYNLNKGVQYISYAALILLLGWVWFDGFKSLATFLGLLSAGFAIALREPVVNFAGWLFILWRQPFSVGDRIVMNGLVGDVLDINLFNFALMEVENDPMRPEAQQSKGVLVWVPNGKVFSQNIHNFNCMGFTPIWHEIPILLTFDSDWRAAKPVFEKIAARHALKHNEALQHRLRAASQRILITYSNLTPRVYTSIHESGVLLTIRYLVEPRQRRDTHEAICEAILDTLNTVPGIRLAYPTRFSYSVNMSVDPAQADDLPSVLTSPKVANPTGLENFKVMTKG